MKYPEIEKDCLLYIIRDQIRRRPAICVQDLYKLVFQATCGNVHLLKNSKEVKSTLVEEWKELGKIRKGEPLLEMIDPMGRIIRVNLRVFRKIGGSVDPLFNLMVRSARMFSADRKRLETHLAWIADWAEEGKIFFEKEELTRFWSDMEERNFSPVHHSKNYTDAYNPAYRVVLKKLWEEEDILGNVLRT